MISKPSPSLSPIQTAQEPSLPLSERRQTLRTQLEACRHSTQQLVADIQDEEFFQQAHPDFSPVGWHLGHIAFTEALWILEHLAGQTQGISGANRQLFAADGLPKADRQQLPSLTDIWQLLSAVRHQVLVYLEEAPLEQQAPLWWWLLQHESQHAETISLILALHRWPHHRGRSDQLLPCRAASAQRPFPIPSLSAVGSLAATDGMLYIPAGNFAMGYDGVDAIDNEQPVHQVATQAFWIDRFPVTRSDYRHFMEAGGYSDATWWSLEGWAWLQQNPVQSPQYWSDDSQWDAYPVFGVNWYEANAYARFVGKRLPSEAEWEQAARQISVLPEVLPQDPIPAGVARDPLSTASTDPGWLGNVWEWTASIFAPYPGFQPFPYRGYSQAYFDGQHRVLRGGSWATRPWALRVTVRNWYHPHVRQVLAGFRCVQ